MTAHLFEPIYFCCPSRVLFGLGVRRQVPQLLHHLGLRSAVLVTDGYFAGSGRAGAEMAVALREAGIQCLVFDGCLPDPSLELCDHATSTLRGRIDPQCVIALGGGSSIDLAKVLTLTLVSGKPAASLVGISSLPHDPLPLVALPTTSGTASELTPGAILVAGDGQAKVAIMDNKLRAQVAVIDPELSVSCPARVTADAGVDALAHAIESYIAQDASQFDREGHPDPGYSGRNALTRMFARESIRLCFAHLHQAYAEPGDMTARSGMALASLYAGLSYGSAGLHGVHALAYGLAALTHDSHGTTNAAMLPYVMAELAEERMEDLCEIARMAGAHTAAAPTRAGALAAAQHVRSLIASVGLPTDLARMQGVTRGPGRTRHCRPGCPTPHQGLPGRQRCGEVCGDCRGRVSRGCIRRAPRMNTPSLACCGVVKDHCLGAFRLQSGLETNGLRLRYELHGQLNADGSNAILFPTWFAGRHSANRWIIGPGRALDTNRFCVIVVNALGNGESSSPSNDCQLLAAGCPAEISLFVFAPSTNATC